MLISLIHSSGRFQSVQILLVRVPCLLLNGRDHDHDARRQTAALAVATMPATANARWARVITA
jgi:hypothetical protein